MNVAKEISTWSKDPSSKIGAVIVNDEKRILSTGYNGFPRGITDSDKRLNNRGVKYNYIIHGEMNALLNALYNGISVRDATMYVYGLPICPDCTKSVIQSGITTVVVQHPSVINKKDWVNKWNERSLPLFEEANTKVIYL